MPNDEQAPSVDKMGAVQLSDSKQPLSLVTEVDRKQSTSSLSSVDTVSSPESSLGSPAASSMMSGLAAEMQARVLALQSSRLKRTASSASQGRGLSRTPSLCRTSSSASNSNVDLVTPTAYTSGSDSTVSSGTSPVSTPHDELRRLNLNEPSVTSSKSSDSSDSTVGEFDDKRAPQSSDAALAAAAAALRGDHTDSHRRQRPWSSSSENSNRPSPSASSPSLGGVPSGALAGGVPSGALTGGVPSGALTGASLSRTPSSSRVLPVPTATTLKKAHMISHTAGSMSSRWPGLSLRDVRCGGSVSGAGESSVGSGKLDLSNSNGSGELQKPQLRTASGRRPSGLVIPPPPPGGAAGAALAGPAVRSQRKSKLFAYQKYIDVDSGSLNFAGKAVIHSKGIDFSSGTSFRISLDEFEPLEELGAGNYGTVTRVVHKPTNVEMAMKEIRLELDEASFRQIIMELDILHRCHSEYMVDFYGAFFVEGAVYLCLEYMDGGSMNQIYENGIPEKYLREISRVVVLGLKDLKERHKIIHRDVKPTNILCSSTTGKIKLCDFGVSGNLVASIARTNIGCQSYMAPERINYGASAQAAEYSVESDIWSLGLSIIEMASGVYPYPADIYSNIFSQLSAIVEGQPPQLDSTAFSPEACSFVAACLSKDPRSRASYADLLAHPWLADHPALDHEEMATFVRSRLAENKRKDQSSQ